MDYKNEEEKFNRTWISLYRKFIDWEWYQNGNVTRVFLHCLLKANWQDKNWQGQEIKRGQFVSSYRKIAAELNLSIQQVRTAILKLKSTQELTLTTTSVYSIITVNNYNSYQDTNTRFNKEITNEQQTNNRQITTTNNDNKEINITTTSTTEEKFLKENPDFKFLGEYHNVGLTEKQIRKLECMILNRKKLDQYIEELSENIAEKKEKNFDFEYPNMHEVRIKKYWLKDKNGRKTTQTTQNKPFSEMTDDEKKKYLKNKKSKGENLTPEEKEYYADITYGD